MLLRITRVALLAVAACVAHGGVIDFATLQPRADGTTLVAGDIDQADMAVGFRTLNADLSEYSQAAGFWNAGYSDLAAAAYSETIGRILEITLTPIGFAGVTLDGFYLGSYSGGPQNTADVFRVTDGNGNILWSDETYTYAANPAAALIQVGVTAPVLKLVIGPNWNLGVNLLSYETTNRLPDDEDPPEVPEPSTYALVGAGLALAAWRRRSGRAASR